MSKLLCLPDDDIKVIDDLAGPSALPKSCLNLRFTVGLRRVKIMRRMCHQHIDAIADLGNIKTLEVSEGMDVQLAAVLADQLPQLTSLNLNLYNNSIGAAGAQSLSAFSGMQQLTSLNLYLGGNSIGAAGAQSLSAFSGMQQLTSLDLNLYGMPQHYIIYIYSNGTSPKTPTLMPSYGIFDIYCLKNAISR